MRLRVTQYGFWSALKVKSRLRREPAIMHPYLRMRRSRMSLGCRLAFLQRNGLTARHTATISFIPEHPTVESVIGKICLYSGYKKQTTPALPCDLVVSWEDTTLRQTNSALAELQTHRPVVNIDCLDISKQKVDELHRQVFGYRLAVDPATFEGLGVKKSNLNARHNGEEINLPIKEPEPNTVYQRCVHNATADGLVQDIRIPVFGRNLPFAYLKYRPKSRRFSNKNSHVKLAAINDILSSDEQVRVVRLCQLLGLDYGEVDALRDEMDGRLYVVDVNSTPYGPPNGLSRSDHWRALEELAACFQSTFIEA